MCISVCYWWETPLAIITSNHPPKEYYPEKLTFHYLQLTFSSILKSYLMFLMRLKKLTCKRKHITIKMPVRNILHPGETVRIHENKFESAGIVTSQGRTPRSYIVQMDSGIYCKNDMQLRPSHIPTPSIPQVRIVPDQNITRPVPLLRNITPLQPKIPPKPMPRTSKQPQLPHSTPPRPEENKVKKTVQV